MKKFVIENKRIIIIVGIILVFLSFIWYTGFVYGANRQKNVDNNKMTCKEIVDSTTGYFDSRHAYFIQSEHGELRIPEGCIGDPR